MDPILKKVYEYATIASLYSKRMTGQQINLNDLSDNSKRFFKSYFVQNVVDVYDRLILLSSNVAIKKVLDKLVRAGLLDQKSNSLADQAVSTKVQAIIDEIFDRTDKYNDFFEAIPVDFLDVPSSIQTKINAEIDSVSKFQVSDFIRTRDDIEAASAAISNRLGRGSNTYNTLKNFGQNSTNVRPVSLSTVETLIAVQDVMDQYSLLINAKRDIDNSIQNYVDFYTTLANDNGLNLALPSSKIAVPTPLGASLEQISARYLGDAGRWLEIAALNGLQAPYIDEIGITKSVVGSTSGGTIKLSNVDGLYVGKSVLLAADGLPFLNARVRNIQSLSQTSHLVDIDQDATGYSESVSATVKYYRSGTINSNMMLYIPSDGAPSTIFETLRLAPEVNDQSVVAAMAQVDIALTTEGDLAMLPNGDVEISAGMANIIQAGKLKLVTPLGSLLQHPNYGVGIQAGTSTADITAQKVSASLATTFALDPRFGEILYSKISKSGPTLRIDVMIDVPQTGLSLPLSVNLRG